MRPHCLYLKRKIEFVQDEFLQCSPRLWFSACVHWDSDWANWAAASQSPWHIVLHKKLLPNTCGPQASLKLWTVVIYQWGTKSFGHSFNIDIFGEFLFASHNLEFKYLLWQMITFIQFFTSVVQLALFTLPSAMSVSSQTSRTSYYQYAHGDLINFYLSLNHIVINPICLNHIWRFTCYIQFSFLSRPTEATWVYHH